MSNDLRYSLEAIPFTRAGAYLKLAGKPASGSGRVELSTASKLPFVDLATTQPPWLFYEAALSRGTQELAYKAEGRAGVLTLHAGDGGQVGLAFGDSNTLVFEATPGLRVEFLPCHSVCTVQWRSAGECSLYDYRGACHHQIRAGRGTQVSIAETLTVRGETGPYADRPRKLVFTATAQAGVWGALRFDPYGELWPEKLPRLREAAGASLREWAAWERKMPAVPPRYRDAAREAWYILWGCQVQPRGLYRRRAMLMSKHWMNQVWSWDNCFNALAVAQADPELALDQLQVVFDHQAPTGALPEPLNDFAGRYGYVKPPVYGWTVMGLERAWGKGGPARLRQYARELYDPIARQTEWWFTYHDSNANRLCEYLHGNDSGWDNATAFDQGYPTEGADLSAHLVLQMEGLARLADLLRKPREAAAWRKRAGEMLRLMLRRQCRGGRFFSPLNGQRHAAPCQSLLNSIPMVLGHRLPAAVRRTLAADLSPGGPFLTEWGWATESPASPKYKPNGYWRGPIWAPSTYLIWDGLRDAGEMGLAREAAERFCRLCATHPGMWENYDALTGKGLCCPAYSWTAAVFILLAQSLAE